MKLLKKGLEKLKIFQKIIKFSLILIMLLVSVLAVSAAPVRVKDGTLNVSNNFWVDWNSFFVDSSSDNVGIGTTSPSERLDLDFADDNDVAIRMQAESSTADPFMQFVTDTTDWVFGIDNSDADKFVIGRSYVVGTNSHLIIDSAGKVGLSTTAPQYELDVNGSMRGNDIITDSGYVFKSLGTAYLDAAAGNGVYIRVNGGGTTAITALSTGLVGIGTTAPGKPFEVENNTAGLSFPVQIANQNDDNADTGTGILFTTGTGGNARGKGVLAYVLPTGNSWNRGDFHFLQNSDAGTNNPTISDSVMIIKNSGNVGIGTVSPAAKLEVNGAVNATEYWSGSNQGLTGTATVLTGGGSCGLVFTDGLLTSTDCPWS